MTTITIGQPTAADLKIYRGDSGTFRVTVVRDGSPVNVASAVWLCQIRATQDDTAAIAELDVTPVPAITNAVDIALPSAESANINQAGVWDLQMTLSGEVTTLLAGKVRVSKDISRS